MDAIVKARHCYTVGSVYTVMLLYLERHITILLLRRKFQACIYFLSCYCCYRQIYRHVLWYRIS